MDELKQAIRENNLRKVYTIITTNSGITSYHISKDEAKKKLNNNSRISKIILPEECIDDILDNWDEKINLNQFISYVQYRKKLLKNFTQEVNKHKIKIVYVVERKDFLPALTKIDVIYFSDKEDAEDHIRMNSVVTYVNMHTRFTLIEVEIPHGIPEEWDGKNRLDEYLKKNEIKIN